MEAFKRKTRYLALDTYTNKYSGTVTLDSRTYESMDDIFESEDSIDADFFEVTQDDKGHFITTPISYDRMVEAQEAWQEAQREPSDFQQHNTHWGL